MSKLEMFALVAYALLFIRQVLNEREINSLRANVNKLSEALKKTLIELDKVEKRKQILMEI